MDETQELEKFEALPLRLSYDFLEEKGFAREADDIRMSQDRYKSYSSSLKRGKVLILLEDNNLLDEFIDKCWPLGKTEKGKSKIKRYKRIYDAFMGNERGEEEEEEESAAEAAFAYEEDLRDYLAKNLSKIGPGLNLYKDKEGREGIEYPIDTEGKRVDILAIDKHGIPVIIELKVSRGHERVIGQSLYYRNKVKELIGSPKARIVIVAREITPQLRIATEGLPDCDLFEYELSVNLRRLR